MFVDIPTIQWRLAMSKPSKKATGTHREYVQEKKKKSLLSVVKFIAYLIAIACMLFNLYDAPKSIEKISYDVIKSKVKHREIKRLEIYPGKKKGMTDVVFTFYKKEKATRYRSSLNSQKTLSLTNLAKKNRTTRIIKKDRSNLDDKWYNIFLRIVAYSIFLIIMLITLYAMYKNNELDFKMVLTQIALTTVLVLLIVFLSKHFKKANYDYLTINQLTDRLENPKYVAGISREAIGKKQYKYVLTLFMESAKEKTFIEIYTVTKEQNKRISLLAKKSDIPITVDLNTKSIWSSIGDLLTNIVLILLPIFVILALLKRNIKKLGSLDPSNDVIYQEVKGDITFEHIGGMASVKEDLLEVIDFLKNPDKYLERGAELPRGTLLEGPPGTGKTFIARGVAGEAGVPFFYVSGSDVNNKYIGVGADRIKALFKKARKSAPCIIFIDELDSLGLKRNSDRQHSPQTLNQILAEMDGFNPASGIVFMAATNHIDQLDDALTRPGRFSRQVHVGLPDIDERTEIIKTIIKQKKIVVSDEVNIDMMARSTTGFSPAKIADLLNEAILNSIKAERGLIDQKDIDIAREKIIMGRSRPLQVTQEEKRLTAYHETGHTLIALYAEDSGHDIHKVTIVPHGRALGMLVRLPQDDQFTMKRSRLLWDIAITLGGHLAEEMKYGKDHVTTGAASDLHQVAHVAHDMVYRWSMGAPGSDYNPLRKLVQNETDAKTIQEAEDEIKKIIAYAEELARQILTHHSELFEKIAETLLDKETLTAQELWELKAEYEKDDEKDETVEPEKTPKEKDA